MPFWLHEPTIVMFFKGISLRYKLLGCLAICASLASLWILLGLIPSQHLINLKETDLSKLATQQDLFTTIAQTSLTVEKEHAELVTQFEQLTANTYDIQAIIRSILDVMQDHKLSCRSIKPKSSKTKTCYQSHQFVLSGKGTFRHIVTFLQELHENSFPIKFSTIKFEKAKGKSVHFQVSMRIITVQEAALDTKNSQQT